MRTSFIVITALAGTALVPSPADAYIGPGAGISAFGSLLALIAALGVTLVGFVWFPLKRAIRLFKSHQKPDVGAVSAETRRS